MTDNHLDLLDEFMARIEALEREPVPQRQAAIRAIATGMTPRQRAAFSKVLHERREELELDDDMLRYMRWEDED